MAENSKIEWTDHTFNAWTGCSKVSPACDFCYAESWAKRSGIVQWGNHPRRRTSEGYWKQPLKWNRVAERDGVRRKVFCCSLADVFDNKAAQEWRNDLFSLIDATPWLDWLLLTKRPQNIAKMMPAFFWDTGGADIEMTRANVWLGTTVENQEEANRRIPHLLAVPVRVRFLSCEPLLGPVDLAAITPGGPFANCIDALSGSECWEHNGGDWNECNQIDWVITGGESGPAARPSNPQWFRNIGKQCVDAGVPWFHKQNGEFASVSAVEGPGAHFTFPDGRRVRRVGKKAAGALLDGVAHRGMP